MTNINQPTTIGILYAGDMGSALGRLLRNSGLRVVTTCQERSRRTEEQAHSSGIEVLPGFGDVVAQSDIVFSIVLPLAAIDVAKKYIDHRRLRPPNGIFVEANSTGLEILQQIEPLMAECDIPLVDASIHGTAHRLEELGVLYVSGPRAKQVEEVFRDVLRVAWLGEEIGSASRMKLLMSAMSKTLVGIFLEISVLAERVGMLELFLENCHHFYPGVMSPIERMLPSYPRHAARRAGEILEIEHMAHASQLHPRIIHEAGEILGLVANIDWSKMDPAALDIATIIRSVAEHGRPFERHPETTQ